MPAQNDHLCKKTVKFLPQFVQAPVMGSSIFCVLHFHSYDCLRKGSHLITFFSRKEVGWKWWIQRVGQQDKLELNLPVEDFYNGKWEQLWGTDVYVGVRKWTKMLPWVVNHDEEEVTPRCDNVWGRSDSTLRCEHWWASNDGTNEIWTLTDKRLYHWNMNIKYEEMILPLKYEHWWGNYPTIEIWTLMRKWFDHWNMNINEEGMILPLKYEH